MPKKENTFKFISFHERIEKTHVDVIRRYKTYGNAQPTDADTFFSETLEKWSDLNGTAHFDDFKRSIPRSNLRTYAQVLHYQKELANSLQYHLKVDNSLCIQALLDLTVALCRDLQQDFNEYFWDFFDIIKDILSTASSDKVDVIEACFSCYAYLFKFCRRQLILELETIIVRLLPLISHRRYYIRRFVSESLAYLIRKYRKFDKLLKMCLELVRDNMQTIQGMSDLLVEAMRTVRFQLHSVTSEIYFSLLNTCDQSDQSGFELSKAVTGKLVKSIKAEYLHPIVQTLCQYCEKLHKQQNSCTLLEQSFELWILLTNGVKNSNPLQSKFSEISNRVLFKTLTENGNFITDRCLRLCLSFMSHFWPARDDNLMSFEKILRILFLDRWNIISVDILIEFLESLLEKPESFDLFQTTVLPLLVEFTELYFKSDEKLLNERLSILQIWGKICNIDNPILEVETYEVEHCQLLSKFVRKFPTFVNYLKRILQDRDFSEFNLHTIFASLTVYSSLCTDRTIILNLFTSLFDKFTSSSIPVSTDICFLIFLTVRCLNVDEGGMVESLPFRHFVDQLSFRPDFLPILNVFYEVLCKFSSKLKSTFTNEELYALLQDNLLSFNGSIRLKTMQIFTKLSWPPTDSQMKQNIFDLALQAELTPLTLQNYRDRLMIYRKLGFVEYERYLPEPRTTYRFVPLQILIGQLTVNFSLLLPTLHEMIESHARGQIQSEFWSYFGRLLTSAHESVQSINDVQNKSIPMEIDSDENVTANSKKKFWKILIDEFSQAECEDSLNLATNRYQFRLLLWKCVENFADLAESKSRYFVELFLQLAQTELVSIDQNACSSQDITLDSNRSISDKQTSDEKRKNGVVLRTLVSCLNAFSKFNNPQNIAKESKLRNLYFDLLLHSRTDVQKAALLCVLSYKSKSVTPYRDHMLNLLDDKLFKDQLVAFNIDSDANIVEPDHRVDVLPIVLRIIYGRLFGKGSDASRKQQIYRFLAGSTEQELQTFFEFLFLPIKHYLDSNQTGSLTEVCSSILAEYDCKKAIPFRKMQGILSHLSMVIKRLGRNLTDYRSTVYRLCCVIGSILLRIRNNKDFIQPYFVKFSKKLRHLLLRRITEFCTNFDSYPFCEEEIRALFEFCIWPSVEHLHKSESGRPSIDLVKFCVSLSEIPRYFPLFGIYSHTICTETLLDMLIRRLFDKDCTKSIKDSLSSLLFNLISLSDHVPTDENGPTLPLPSNFDVKLSQISQINDGSINFGTKLVLPNTDRLLTYLTDHVSVVKMCRDEKWMKILDALSEYTSDAANCQRLSSILLSVVKSKFIKNVEIESNLILVVCRLLRHVDNTKGDITRATVELFSIVDNRLSRENLVKVLQRLAESNDCNLGRITPLIEDLNSWYVNRLDEPDYERRSKAFNELNKILKTDSDEPYIDLLGMSLFAHNCGYFVMKSVDFSLRDLSSSTFQTLIETLCRRFNRDSVHTFLTQHVLPLIRVGLKAKDEAIRHEFISLLATCVNCAPDFPKLLGLSKLCDISDPDLNFFENIRHIQIHRRGRAVRRLCEKLNPSGQEEFHIQSEILFNFIWPICYAFIFDPTYRKHTNLIEDSIKFLGCYCRRSPWKRYQSMLKYFLQLLKKDVDKQKLLVKVLVEVLNSFPFDISDVDVDEKSKNFPEIEANMDTDGTSLDVETAAAAATTNTTTTTINNNNNNNNNNELAKSSNKRKIFDSIVNEILPELQKSLSKRTSTEFVHRITAKFVYDEDEEILRAPLALAIVKLLQKLPIQYLETNLPGVVAKVCQMLKSRSWDIRETTRGVLCRMASSLGSRYIPYIVREMREILRRGYQTHVLTYSIHVLLNSLVENLVPGDLGPCLPDVLQICYDDLFGDVSEEKEVDEITKRLKEAKANKTNATYQIIGRLIEYNSLDSVINPFKEVLDRKYSHKVVQKVSEALKYFAQGLICNVSLNVQSLMTFVHKILSENVQNMLVTRCTDNPDENESAVRSSCYDLEKEPPRSGIVPKKSKSNSLHLLVSFGLEILHNLLKHKRLVHDSEHHCSLLDPFLTILIDCTDAKQPKVISTALRCVCWSLQFSLPSLTTSCSTLVNRLFVLLKRYAGIGAAASKGENFELLTMLFKTITMMIKDVEYCDIDAKQLKILLHYAEEDLFDVQKQSTAFALLKAIISRKLVCDDIKTLIRRVEELSIVSQMDTVRQQCRQLIFKYMSLYPEGRHPKRAVEFFCSQLEYEYEEGRLSALEMLNTFIDMFSSENIDEYCLLLFVHVSLRLVNDESSKIKQMASVTVKNLLSKINAAKLEAVFRMIYEWLADDKIIHKKLAAHLLGVINGFVDALSVADLLSAVVECLSSVSTTSAATDDSQIALYDHTTFLSLVALEKYFVRLPSIIRDAKYTKHLNDIWELLHRLVDHPHVWVRLVVCRLYGLLFSHYKPDELLCLYIKSDEYFLRNPKLTIKQLCDAFLRRFRAIDCASELSEQVIKNLVFLARCVRRMSQILDVNDGSRSTTPTEEEAVATLLRDENDSHVVTVDRLASQLIRVCRLEISKQPGQTIKRTNVFKWIAAVCLDSTVEEFMTLLPIILPSLHREMELPNSDSALKRLASEVLDIIKLKIGEEQLSMNLAKIKKVQNDKRLERKRKLADEAVANPERAARRKMRKHQLQAESKKKKMFAKKGKNVKKTAKLFHLNIEDD